MAYLGWFLQNVLYTVNSPVNKLKFSRLLQNEPEKKKTTDKRVRSERDVVLETIFSAFEKHQYYTLKDLINITQQPVVCSSLYICFTDPKSHDRFSLQNLSHLIYRHIWKVSYEMFATTTSRTHIRIHTNSNPNIATIIRQTWKTRIQADEHVFIGLLPSQELT